MIYFIQDQSSLLVKIGYTAFHPKKRLRQLQSKTSSSLKILAFHQGDRKMEAEYHRMFSRQRVYGEWFRLNGDLLIYLLSCAYSYGIAAGMQSADFAPRSFGSSFGIFEDSCCRQ